jgi:hypothetical protein
MKLASSSNASGSRPATRSTIGREVGEKSTIHIRPEGALSLDETKPIAIGAVSGGSTQMKM